MRSGSHICSSRSSSNEGSFDGFASTSGIFATWYSPPTRISPLSANNVFCFLVIFTRTKKKLCHFDCICVKSVPVDRRQVYKRKHHFLWDIPAGLRLQIKHEPCISRELGRRLLCRFGARERAKTGFWYFWSFIPLDVVAGVSRFRWNLHLPISFPQPNRLHVCRPSDPGKLVCLDRADLWFQFWKYFRL